jgi:glyoxylase-like metal-dependent hydrolase (beta-lactamase superfamily II)
LVSSAPDAGIRTFSIPTPFAVGRVNCYLIEDDPLTLIDTGPNSGMSLDAMDVMLHDAGHDIADLERIVITHQHMDHLGLVDVLSRRSGADVYALRALGPWLAEYPKPAQGDDEFAERLMARHGIEQPVRLALRAVAGMARAWGAAAEVTGPLDDGGELPFAGRTLHVHHRPGHSPSDLIFHDRERGVLIVGDHLIKHISSNAVVTRPLDGSAGNLDEPHSLVVYLDSLRATREMDAELVLPGHGEPITDHRALIDERLGAHERRADKIERLVRERPRTAHQLAQEMWGNVAVTQAYLTLSEILGHTDLLVAQGRVREVVEDDIVRFDAGY